MSAAEIESGVKEERGSPRKKVRKEKSVKARAEASKVRPRGAFRGFYDCWWDDQRAGWIKLQGHILHEIWVVIATEKRYAFCIIALP